MNGHPSMASDKEDTPSIKARAEGEVNAEDQEPPPATLKTIAAAYMDIYEREEKRKPSAEDSTELVRLLGEAVGTSAESGDPGLIVMSLEAVYARHTGKGGEASPGGK